MIFFYKKYLKYIYDLRNINMKIKTMFELAEKLDRLNQFEQADIFMRKLAQSSSWDEKDEDEDKDYAIIVACFLYDGPIAGYGLNRRQPIRLIGWEIADEHDLNEEKLIDKYITEPNSQQLMVFIVPKILAESWAKNGVICSNPYAVLQTLEALAFDSMIIHMPRRYSLNNVPLTFADLIIKALSGEELTRKEEEELFYALKTQLPALIHGQGRNEITDNERFRMIMEGILKDEEDEEDEENN